jgi:hypothetical protein
MPSLPDIQPNVREWITLRQALCWIVRGLEPDLVGAAYTLSLPPEFDHACRQLFRLFSTDKLKVRGKPAINITLTYNEQSSAPEAECSEFGNETDISAEIFRRTGFDSIDWKYGELKHASYDHSVEAAVISIYMSDLCVRWSDLRQLTEEGRSVGVDAKERRLEDQNQDREQSGKKRSVATSKRQGGRKPRDDWPMLAALSAILSERDPKFWRKGIDKKIEDLKNILVKVGHFTPETPAPRRSQFGITSWSYVKTADDMLAEQCSPSLPSPGFLPLVSALVAIVREHDREPGNVSCECEMTKQVELLLSAAADLVGNGFLGLSDSDLYERAQAITKHASEVHKKFCRKLRLRPI